jgi:hypothetical protein
MEWVNRGLRLLALLRCMELEMMGDGENLCFTMQVLGICVLRTAGGNSKGTVLDGLQLALVSFRNYL